MHKLQKQLSVLCYCIANLPTQTTIKRSTHPIVWHGTLWHQHPRKLFKLLSCSLVFQWPNDAMWRWCEVPMWKSKGKNMFLVPQVWSKFENGPWSKLCHWLVLVLSKSLFLVPIFGWR